MLLTMAGRQRCVYVAVVATHDIIVLSFRTTGDVSHHEQLRIAARRFDR